MQRAKFDKNGKLALFCQKLEQAVLDTVKAGFMTKDLALCISRGKAVNRSKYLSTDEFMNKVSDNFKSKI